MSDEGESPPLSPSPLPSEDDKSLTPQDTPPRSRSPHSRSRSAGNNIARSRSHTPRSRTRSRSRHRSLSKSYSRHSRGESGGHRNVRYYSRSRSRTPRKKRYSRSHSKSYSPHRSDYGGYSRGHGGSGGGGGGRSYYEYSEKRSRGGDYYQRSHSRSPMSSRRRHVGNRENPPQSRCLGIFGLSLYTQERDLREVFGKYGAVEEIRVVCDAQTGRSRGFAFIYFETTEDAKVAKDRCTGLEIDGRRIRVDFSITHRAHTPTPGIYMGKPTYSGKSSRGEKGYYGSSGGGGGGGGSGGYRRSPSPYYSRGHRYSRSRSRSYSPRKYDYAY